MSDDKRNEGEGSRSAARHYNEATREFTESGKVEDKAREAADVSEEEKARLREAEKAGKSHAKEEDPALRKDSGKAGGG